MYVDELLVHKYRNLEVLQLFRTFRNWDVIANLEIKYHSRRI